ncbi:glycoside hydrolase family 127 protein [Horticoccus sp. 23ND18S-11]|uniref:glycoside hydrolase family 127 protein n=1 Tax=Horticoccus sp. 23ND18S-11 TaxID=3391832 RepID=UPI0039C9B75F
MVDTSRSPAAKLSMVNLGDVRWNGGLLGERFEVCRTTMVPHLWTIFKNDTESHAWSNFLIAAGQGRGRDGKFHGPPFNDGDFLKWLEALAQVYALTREPALDAQMDEIIAVVAKAQREDGYLHTQKIIPQRQGDPQAKEFADREHFETYNMGHLMTAACVHHRATGKTTLLALARKAADYIEQLCATVPEDLARNAICPSHYMGVAELYRVTREPRYLALARRLIEIRDLVPASVGSDHNQDRVPFRQMTEAVGHAVRANYLYAGVADLLAESGDPALLTTLTALADDVATQKLYITGMTGALYDGASPDGSSKHGSIKTVHQAYGRDYQLPNLTAYNETCATIGYAMWMWRMLAVTGEARYADLFEQSLYNGVLPGISLEGKDYFYVNPLRKLQDFKVPLRWSRTRTPNIKSSFCCPPNVVRTIAEAHNYVYAVSPDTLWVNLYAASTLDTAWAGGGRLKLRQATDYPWDGAIRITLDAVPDRAVALKLRIPGWLRPGRAMLRINDQVVNQPLVPGTYAEVKRAWAAGDVIQLALEFSPSLWEANPLVEETLDQVAVRSGPLVYCVESNDLPAGARLSDVAFMLRASAPVFTPARERIAGAAVQTWSTPGIALQRPAWSATDLYREVTRDPPKEIRLKFVPYFAWGNRGDTEMSVWLPVR